MDIGGLTASTASQTARQQVGNAAGIAVLNKVMDVEKQTATQLINSVPQPARDESLKDKLPPHLGQNIDLTA